MPRRTTTAGTDGPCDLDLGMLLATFPTQRESLCVCVRVSGDAETLGSACGGVWNIGLGIDM